MPTYEYECIACGKVFERFQSMNAEPLRDCPACGGRVRRGIGGGAGILVKRSGTSLPCGGEKPCCGRDVRCERPPCA